MIYICICYCLCIDICQSYRNIIGSNANYLSYFCKSLSSRSCCR